MSEKIRINMEDIEYVKTKLKWHNIAFSTSKNNNIVFFQIGSRQFEIESTSKGFAQLYKITGVTENKTTRCEGISELYVRIDSLIHGLPL